MDAEGKAQRTVDGKLFASRGEANRYEELKLLEKSGEIRDLMLQERFPLFVNGQKICTYIADFCYFEKERPVIEDFKGQETPEFKLKWKMLQAQLGTDFFIFRITKAKYVRRKNLR